MNTTDKAILIKITSASQIVLKITPTLITGPPGTAVAVHSIIEFVSSLFLSFLSLLDLATQKT
jgi:hypothetical protein